MDIDELQSVQSRERQTDSLQQLRDSFYADASEYIQTLRESRDRAAERADDPYGDPEVKRLSDEIETAEQTVEAIYDRRTGKIVKKASLAAADMPTDEDGLTAEERALFESLVDQIVDNRDHVLDMIAGDVTPDATPGGTDTGSTAEPSPPEATGEPGQEVPPPDEPGSDVSAADLMSGDGGAEPRPEPTPDAPDGTPDVGPAGDPDDGPAGGEPPTEPDAAGGPESREADPEGESGSRTDEPTTIDRTTVQITQDVGEILGVDQRAYDLSADDVVTLPEANAGPLLERDAAEKL